MNCQENCHPHINRISQSGLQTIGHQNLLRHADSWVSSQLFNQTFRVKPSQICSVTISAGESHKHTLKFENHCLRKQRRQGHPTPVLLPGKSHGQGSLVDCMVVHGVTTSQTQVSDFTFTFHFHALEKEMATHSNVLAWRIPGTGEPGGLPSMGSHRVGHDWCDLAAAALERSIHSWSCRPGGRGRHQGQAFSVQI